MLDLIISHGIDLTDIAIVPQSNVTDHFLVSCMLHITDINYMALRYRPGTNLEVFRIAWKNVLGYYRNLGSLRYGNEYCVGDAVWEKLIFFPLHLKPYFNHTV